MDMTTQDQKKGKGSRRNFKKKRDSREESTPVQYRNNISKLICYKCQKLRHYAFQFSQKNIEVRNGEKKVNRRSTSKQKKKVFSKIKCYKCQEIGHFAYQCPQKRRK